MLLGSQMDLECSFDLCVFIAPLFQRPLVTVKEIAKAASFKLPLPSQTQGKSASTPSATVISSASFLSP